MPEFFHLNGGQHHSSPAIPVPPPHHQPGVGGPPPPPMVHQQRPMPMAAPMSLSPRPLPPSAPPFPSHPPHPPRNIIPSHFQRPVVVSDIRNEGLTEEDIREDLSEYVILRFQKIQPYDEYDSDGEEVKAGWDNCTRTRIVNVDKVDARREIRRLNKEDAKKGKTLLEKQNDLSPKQQGQIAKAERDLSLEEQDARFHTVLAQIDSTLKPVIQKREKVYVRKSNTKRKIHQKKRYERISITAYFKRCPKNTQRPSELARAIGMERQRESEAMRMRHQAQDHHMAPPRRHQPQPGPMVHSQASPVRSPGPMHAPIPAPIPRPMPQPVAQPMAQPMPQPMPGRPMPGPMPGPMHGAMHGPMHGAMHRPQVMPMQQPHHGQGIGRPHTPIRVEVDHRKGEHHKSRHSRSSDSSEYSDSDSGSELGSESTLVTEPSHSSGSRNDRKHRGTKRRSLKYLEEPRNFGVDVYRPSRRHSLIEDGSYIVTGSGARVPIIQVAVPPRKAAIPVEEIDQIEAEAYRAGRSDQKVADRHTMQGPGSLDHAARRYRPRHAPRPEIIHDPIPPVRIRHVTSSEVDRQLEDDFYRLRLDREDLNDSVHFEAQRRREARAREEQENIMRAQLDEEMLYRRRREESPPSSANPFSPLQRRAGRTYDFDRDYRR